MKVFVCSKWVIDKRSVDGYWKAVKVMATEDLAIAWMRLDSDNRDYREFDVEEFLDE